MFLCACILCVGGDVVVVVVVVIISLKYAALYSSMYSHLSN